jgi:hypothetical protein
MSGAVRRDAAGQEGSLGEKAPARDFFLDRGAGFAIIGILMRCTHNYSEWSKGEPSNDYGDGDRNFGAEQN